MKLSPPPAAAGALRARTPLSLARHLPTLWGVTLAEGAKKVNSGCRTDTRCFFYKICCISSLLRRVFMPTLSTMPTQRYIMTTLDPPAEKNGSVTPMTGSTCKFMPMFITHCKNSAAKMPTQILQPSASGHCRPVRSVRRQSAKQQQQHRRRAQKAQNVCQIRKNKIVPGVGHKDVLPGEQPLPRQPAGANGHGPLVLLVGNVRQRGVIGGEYGQDALELVALQNAGPQCQQRRAATTPAVRPPATSQWDSPPA